MKIFNIIFIVIFIISAALQYNDPDPYIWIPIYLFAAYLCFKAIQHKYNRVLYLIGIAVYLFYAAFLFYDNTGVLSWMQQHQSESIVQSMHAEKPWIEETREFFGLLIVILVLLVNMLWLRKKRKNQ